MTDLREILSFLQFHPMLFILITLFFCSFSYCHVCLSRKHEKSFTPTNWPVFGMLPAVFQNFHRLHDYGTEILIENQGTFVFKGPWFSNVNMVLTCDPANIQHILSDRFSNYPRGPEFLKIVDMVGDGIFNAEDELWEIHRKVTLSVLQHTDYKSFLQETMLKKLENVLLPMLKNFSETKMEIDMQDILDRFTFDIFSQLVLGYDPGSLSPDLPKIACQHSFTDIEKAIVQRHIIPESCWKLQKWLNFGKERKLLEALEAINNYIYPCIDKMFATNEGMQFNSKTAFLQAYKTAASSTNPILPPITRKFLRDVHYTLLSAGKDTITAALTWFFFLIAKNPSVEAKIVEELEKKTGWKGQEWAHVVSNMEEYAPKLVYLHGAICETLRLFPPVAMHHKAPVKPDILPSGVKVSGNTKVLLFFYSMGRMESVWGKDCLEFRPERWITDKGTVKHQPASKFVAFNAGPRTCVGKSITFSVMRMLIVSVICNYHVTLVDGHHVLPDNAVVINMKHGLKVMLSKKSCAGCKGCPEGQK